MRILGGKLRENERETERGEEGEERRAERGESEKRVCMNEV